jgi:hypothetical protein
MFVNVTWFDSWSGRVYRNARRSSHVELKVLLATLSSDRAMTSQAIWWYALSVLNIILSIVVFTSRYWWRAVRLVMWRIFPCFPETRPGTSQVTSCQAAPRCPNASSVTTDSPCCLEIPDANAETIIGPASGVQPKPAERVHFARPDKFELWKWTIGHAVALSNTDKWRQRDAEPQDSDFHKWMD